LDAEGALVVNTPDLTATEQTNVRTALKFLRARCGTWAILGKALRFGENTLVKIASGKGTATPTIAFRVAKFASVTVDDVLKGRFPEAGTCPMCGHMPEEVVDAIVEGKLREMERQDELKKVVMDLINEMSAESRVRFRDMLKRSIATGIAPTMPASVSRTAESDAAPVTTQENPIRDEHLTPSGTAPTPPPSGLA
jgi:hypothetical protein